MKVKWKIVLGVLTLIAVLASLYSLIYQRESLTPNNTSQPQTINSEGEGIFGHEEKLFFPFERGLDDGGSIISESLDKHLEEMELGTIAFNSPSKINIDGSSQIQLLMSLSETLDKLQQSITEKEGLFGDTIKVSDIMKAHLSGDMFQIVAITPEKQAISKRLRTEWKWEIHPKREGEHKLHLALTAYVEIEGYNTPRTIKTFDKIINVKVTATQKIGLFFKGNWQWLWAAILVPIVGWLWKRRGKKLTNKSN